jgi:putative FmdB family regulatory protein
MPTYEYECQDCKVIFERFQKMSDDPLKICPECNGRVSKIPSVCGGIIFKGKGFYSTDNKSAKTPVSAAKNSSETEKCSETCSEKKKCPLNGGTESKGSENKNNKEKPEAGKKCCCA